MISAAVRSEHDWRALAGEYHQAAHSEPMAKFRRRRWSQSDEMVGWLEQDELTTLTERQALSLYRAAGGRRTGEFRANSISEIRDAIDFLLYDTVKLESRFDECASPEGGFGLEGIGREWPSYLLTLRNPGLFAPWSPHTERALRGLGMYRAALNRGHVGLGYLELLDIASYLRARLQLADFRALDEFYYHRGRARRPKTQRRTPDVYAQINWETDTGG
jgi:hypothetical protein